MAFRLISVRLFQRFVRRRQAVGYAATQHESIVAALADNGILARGDLHIVAFEAVIKAFEAEGQTIGQFGVHTGADDEANLVFTVALDAGDATRATRATETRPAIIDRVAAVLAVGSPASSRATSASSS